MSEERNKTIQKARGRAAIWLLERIETDRRAATNVSGEELYPKIESSSEDIRAQLAILRGKRSRPELRRDQRA